MDVEKYKQLMRDFKETLTSKNPKKDWPEDFADEDNGCYFCVCWKCESQFLGNKRRFQCKECSETVN